MLGAAVLFFGLNPSPTVLLHRLRAFPSSFVATDLCTDPIMPAPTTNRSRGTSSKQRTSSESKIRFPSRGISALCAGRCHTQSGCGAPAEAAISRRP